MVFGPAPSSREFPIANLEGILQGRPPMKIAQRVSGRASSKVPCPGSGATDGGRACSQVQRQRSRRRERSCGSRDQTASRGQTLRTRRVNARRLGARKRELRPDTPMLAPSGVWRLRTVSHSPLPSLDDGGARVEASGYAGTAGALETRRIPPGCTGHLASWVPRTRVDLRHATADACTFLLGCRPRSLS